MLDSRCANNRNVTQPAHFRTMTQPALWALGACLGGSALLLLLGGWPEPLARGFIYLSLCMALVSGLSLVPGLSRLSVETDGITIHTLLWRQHIRWENLHRFMVLDFDDTGIGLTPSWARYSIGYVVSDAQLGVMPRLYRKFHEFYGCHGSLPPVDKIAPADLLHILNRALSNARRPPEQP